MQNLLSAFLIADHRGCLCRLGCRAHRYLWCRQHDLRLLPYVVKTSMASVVGVDNVAISLEAMTATVTFDDGKTTAEAIAAASTNAGYPAHPQQEADGLPSPTRTHCPSIRLELMSDCCAPKSPQMLAQPPLCPVLLYDPA